MMFGNGENRRGEYETRRRARGAPPGLREIATPAKIEDIYAQEDETELELGEHGIEKGNL